MAADAMAETPPTNSASGLGSLDELLQRRMVFVAGKGGTGKTTLAAALALTAARRGKRVLGIEVDAKGDLAQALGHAPVGFQPQVVHNNLSVLALHPEESFQEYLRIFFKVPRIARHTPLKPVFDFIATGVPGPKDMLVIGKIAYEERRREDDRPLWDIIIVDCTATGHAVAQLTAARAMRQLVRGGVIASQVSWVDAAISDPARTALCVTVIPEEMPVVETIELHDAAKRAHLPLGICFLNRMVHLPLGSRERALITELTSREHAAAVAHKLGVPVQIIAEGVEFGDALTAAALPFARKLRHEITMPVIEVPLVATRPGMATTREIATLLSGHMA